MKEKRIKKSIEDAKLEEQMEEEIKGIILEIEVLEEENEMEIEEVYEEIKEDEEEDEFGVEIEEEIDKFFKDRQGKEGRGDYDIDKEVQRYL